MPRRDDAGAGSTRTPMKTTPNYHDFSRLFDACLILAEPPPERGAEIRPERDAGHDFLLLTARPDLLPEPARPCAPNIRH